MARKPKRDMDEPVNIEGDFEEALTAMLNDPELDQPDDDEGAEDA